MIWDILLKQLNITKDIFQENIRVRGSQSGRAGHLNCH